jgi:DNA-binding response OmpR family regulator
MAKLKVLIAEDEPVSLRLMEASLTNWGYQAVSAQDGEQARALLQAGGIHVCILDWEMPRLSGIELCKWIRSATFSPAPYVIILSNHKDSRDIQIAYQAGADTHLSKPFDRTVLHHRISAYAKSNVPGAQLPDAAADTPPLSTSDLR